MVLLDSPVTVALVAVEVPSAKVLNDAAPFTLYCTT